MSTLFLSFVALMSAIVIGLSARFCSRNTALAVGAGLALSLLYVGVVGNSGILRDTTVRPPAMLLILGPVTAFLGVMIVRSILRRHLPPSVPLWLLLTTQIFRVGVELFLHQLWIQGLIPRMLTFNGANVDIYVGASAPFVAWISTRGRSGLWTALAWNILGLLALANVVTRAVLSTPGPLNLIHEDVPNLLFGTFPYTFIPGFFVPLAVTLHVLSIRAIHIRLLRDRFHAPDGSSRSTTGGKEPAVR